MSERALRHLFIWGSLLFMGILIGMSVDSVGQMKAGRTPPVTSQVASGKQVWQSKNCNDCHTILGIGGYFAPELTKVVDRRGADWLVKWLKDPKAVDPLATMPNQRLNDGEVADSVAFLQWVGKIDTNGWPPQPVIAAAAGGSATAQGELLFVQKGCSGCHTINGKGGTFGPDLSRIGSVPYDGLPNTTAFLILWLEDPKKQKADTVHPQIPLAEPEIDALAEYLTSLK